MDGTAINIFIQNVLFLFLEKRFLEVTSVPPGDWVGGWGGGLILTVSPISSDLLLDLIALLLHLFIPTFGSFSFPLD